MTMRPLVLISAFLLFECLLKSAVKSHAFAPHTKSTLAFPKSPRFGTTDCRMVLKDEGGDDGVDSIACDTDVIIIGGGLVGAATGLALSRRGKSCTIYEQTQSLRKVGAAIGLYPNGLSALEHIAPDVAKMVRKNCSPCLVFERRDASTDEVVRSTSVPHLNETSPVMYAWFLLQQHLVEALPEDCLQLGHSFQSYKVLDDGRVEVYLLDNGKEVTKTCRLLIGADGIHSRVRCQLLGEPPTTNYYGKVMYRAVIEKERVDRVLEIPEGSQISWQGTEIGKSFSVRETTEGIITVTAAALDDSPNGDSRSANATVPHDNFTHKKHLQSLFSGFSPTVGAIIGLLPDTFHRDFLRDINVPNETGWCDGQQVLLVGDAVHAMTPGMGQGANLGLEDACEVVETIVQKRPLSDFVRARIDRVRAIQERSAENTLQSNAYTRDNASTPFQRRKYSQCFKDDLYRWKPSLTKAPTRE